MLIAVCRQCGKPVDTGHHTIPSLCPGCSRKEANRIAGAALHHRERCRKTAREMRLEADSAWREARNLGFLQAENRRQLERCLQQERQLAGDQARSEDRAAMLEEAARLAGEASARGTRDGQGTFLVLEGVDGSGKTEQAGRLTHWLETRLWQAVLRTQEPWLTDANHAPANPVQGQEFFTRQREAHMAKHVLPALEEGTWVLSDRCYLSTGAYQGGDNWRDVVAEQETRFRRPDLAVILLVDPKTAGARIQSRPAHPYENPDTLRKAARAYREMAGELDWAVPIEGERPREEIADRIQEAVLSRFRNPLERNPA